MSKSKSDEKKIVVKEEKGPSLNDLRENNDTSFKDVIKDLSINEFYTKADVKQQHNKFITAVVPEADWNYMSDLLQLPTTSKGYKWLLVVVDLATNLFDIQEMKNKEANTTLTAFKQIIKRGILKLPEISLKTDNGTEFKGAFHKYLIDHKIFHKYSMPYRHQQQSPVEGLNATIARILMTYLNDKSVEMGEDYYNWDDILDLIREEVNEYRKRDMSKLKEYQAKRYFNVTEAGEPEYNIGDYVHWRIDRPTDILGNPINDNRFRKGDRIYSIETRKIVDILYYPSKPFYRYKLHDMLHVSFSASQLKPSEQEGDFYEVKKILNIRTVDGEKFALVWWKGYKKDESSWVECEQLIEDGLGDTITEYEQSVAPKQTKGKKPMPKKIVAKRVKREKYTPQHDTDSDEENPYFKPGK